MDFFDNVTQMANDAAVKLKKGTVRLVDNTKLIVQIRSEQVKVRGMQTEIGRLIYEQYKKDPMSVSEDIRSFCQSIDESVVQIEALRRIQNKTNNQKECAHCHATISAKDKFCPKCGAKQDDGDDNCGCGCCCDDDSDCGCGGDDSSCGC